MNCKHEQIQTWRTDDGTPVMWSCVDCNHKFEPLVIRKPLTDEQERKAFEQWYACNAFDYERNPIGSRECGLQWSAWKARAAHGITGEQK